MPIPHFRLVDLMRTTLGMYGHEIVDDHHGVSEDGSRYFGLLSLRSPYTEAEREALVELLRETIATDRYPRSPRIKMLKAILAKLEPVVPKSVPVPPPKPAGQPSLLLRKKGRR